MKMRRATLLALLLLGACATTSGSEDEGAWVSDEISVVSERILWEVTVLSLQKHDFPIGSGVDPTTMRAVTGWRNDLAPFRGQGFRERAHVRYEAAGPNRYEVHVRVEHQNNMDITRPTDARYAQWEPGQDDTVEAGVILQRIKAWIGEDFQVGDTLEPTGN
jgi:hypothetical protein